MDAQQAYLGLSPHEVLRFASVIVVGMTMMLTSSASYFLERRHGHRPMFAITLMLLAWATLTLGTATSGVGRLFPPMLVAAPLLSGFIGPSLYIYTRQLTTPHKPVSLRWFWLGIFGTIYSILSLTLPNGLDYATQAIVYQEPYWHPVLSPIITLQSLQLVTFAVVSTGLITRTFLSNSRPDLRQTQFWLFITCWTCLAILFVTSVLPIFSITLVEVEPAAMTLPIALVGLLSVRALGEELKTLQTGQANVRASRMESLGRMARGLAHDLNNILTAIVGHAELTGFKLKDPVAASRHIKQIIKDSQRAAELLDRMMAYSGRLDQTHRSIQPESALEAAFNSMQLLQSERCQMHMDIRGELPKVRIEPTALSSAIENLLSNALSALDGQAGRVTLRAFPEMNPKIPGDAFGRDSVGGHAMRIEVEDTGRGMTDAESSRALEPFFSARPEGKGLGLVGVLSTVQGADGALWFRSELGIGTRFVMWLPAAPSEALEPPVEIRSLPTRALVVDDNPDILSIFDEILNTLNVTAHGFTSGELALESLSRSDTPNFELALLDIRLGGMDGIELGHRLLHHHAISAIVLLSGDEPGPRLEQFSGHPAVFLRKPPSRLGLISALRQLGFHVRSPQASDASVFERSSNDDVTASTIGMPEVDVNSA